MSKTEPVEVTPEARAAAAEMMERWECEDQAPYLSGDFDEGEVVQAFARFQARLTSQREPSEARPAADNALADEASLKEQAEVIIGDTLDGEGGQWILYSRAVKAVVRALRSQPPAGPAGDDVVERVARSICRAAITHPTEAIEPQVTPAALDAMVENLTIKFYPEARAALRAVPSAAAIIEQCAKVADGYRCVHLGDFHRGYDHAARGIGEAIRAKAPGESERAIIVAWQDIATAPKGTRVIVCTASGTVGEARYRNEGDYEDGWWWAGESADDFYASQISPEPTRWMPLPPPPAQETE